MGVDGGSLLHKGLLQCADKAYEGDFTESVQYCVSQCQALQVHGVKPLVVFDARRLPAKSVVHEKRRERRETARAALQAGEHLDAKKVAQLKQQVTLS